MLLLALSFKRTKAIYVTAECTINFLYMAPSIRDFGLRWGESDMKGHIRGELEAIKATFLPKGYTINFHQ
jgi:hypothetical protein